MFLGRDMMREKDYSEQTAIMIDQEVRRIVDDAYKRTREIITTNRSKLDNLSKTLVEKEVLDEDEIRELVGLGPKPADNDGDSGQPTESPSA